MLIPGSKYIFKLKSLFKNPMALFVHGILSKWYIMTSVTALIVVYWVFHGLNDNGILAAVEKTVWRGFQDTRSVAKYCVPKITKFEDFWYCLKNPPNYTPSEREELLLKGINFEIYKDIKDPYSQ